MRLRNVTFSLVIILICLGFARTTSAQALDISSGGQPTITGAVGGSVTGSANVQDDLVVTINFGEVSPLNTNAIVKVVVPFALRSNQPYQVAVAMSGLTNPNGQVVQASDVGFGIVNPRLLGGAGKICNQSTHIIPLTFNNDPAFTATVGSNGRVSYQSSLANLSGSTVILSGPELSKNNSAKRQQSDGWVFDAIFTLTPQFFAAGVSSVTLTFSISPGPNVPC
jgi:spore coat protein U-like protein